MNLSFLNQVVIKDDKQVSTKETISKAPTAGADLRVYANGAVYPSAEFAKKFQLDFQPKVVVTQPDGSTTLEYGENPGFGLDVFKTSDYPAVSTPTVFIMIAAVPRTLGKIDLFKNCDYTKEGQPKTLVTVQGSTTFGLNSLIPMLEEAYELSLDKDTMPYVDLKVVGNGDKFDMPWFNSNGSSVYNIPKRITRGEDKGKSTYTRREHLTLWALVPYAWVDGLGFSIELNSQVSKPEILQAKEDVPETSGPEEEEEAEDAGLAEAFIPA